MMKKLNYDARAVDGGSTYSLRHIVCRAIWSIVWLVFASWTPRFFHPWRRFLLVKFGASMGKRSDVRGSARVWYPPNLTMEDGALVAGNVKLYNMGKLVIAEGALVSQYAYICGGTHDYTKKDFPLVTKDIYIGPSAWVAAEAFIGPGVQIGEGAVIGARAVCLRDVPPWVVCAGNPANVIKERTLR